MGIHRGSQLALHTYGAGFVKARYATVWRPDLIPRNLRMGLTRPDTDTLECAAIFGSDVQRARAPRGGPMGIVPELFKLRILRRRQTL